MNLYIISIKFFIYSYHMKILKIFEKYFFLKKKFSLNLINKFFFSLKKNFKIFKNFKKNYLKYFIFI